MKKTPAPEGLIACLFTDIEDSTTLSDGLSPEKWKQVAARHDAVLTKCIQAKGGAPERTEGDSFFATFPTTKAALECAIAIQNALHESGKPLLTVEKNGTTLPIKVRIGVHLATREAYRTAQGTLRDTQVAQAARIMDCGYGGQIVVSEAAWNAAHDYIPQEARRWENRLVRNMDGPQTLHELLWNGQSLGKIRAAFWIPDWFRRAEDSFIGRDTYLQGIEAELKDGHRLVLLHGQGGIGKTRLALQAAERMEFSFEGRVFGVAFDRLTETAPEQVTAVQAAREIALALHAPDNVVENADSTILAAYLNKQYPDAPTLLILDNFESANNDATRGLLGELLGRIRKLRCLVTCRQAFQIGSFSVDFDIGGLAVPATSPAPLATLEGYRLFRERALAADPPPVLSDEAALVRILNATEGSALGIELVASRCRDYSLERIARELENSRLRWMATAKGDTRDGQNATPPSTPA